MNRLSLSLILGVVLGRDIGLVDSLGSGSELSLRRSCSGSSSLCDRSSNSDYVDLYIHQLRSIG